MHIELLDKKDLISIRKFIKIHDNAFSGRKWKKNPYTPLVEENFIKSLENENLNIVLAYDNEKMLGGLAYTLKQELNSIYLSHVCVDPIAQGKGVAGLLLDYVDDKARQMSCEGITLNVGSVWKNARRLYEKKGFIKVGVIAHIPGTYKLIDYIKPIKRSKMNKCRQGIKYLISKAKFFILFRKDSTPRVMHKILYGKGGN